MNASYPTGNVILNDEEGAAVMKKWTVDPTSAESILDGMTLALHEGGHGYNGDRRGAALDDGRGCEMYFYITLLTEPFTTSYAELEAGDKLEFAPCGLTYPNPTDYFSGISRSTILLDSQNLKRPPMDCDGCILSPHDGDGEWGSDDKYSRLYLNDAPAEGKITHYKEGFLGLDPSFTIPANNSFASGDQVFGMLFEETVQYTNTLAWMYSIDDHLKSNSSGKHGLLQFLWWNQRYLKLTRENYPDEHEHWMEYYAEPFLNLWGKAWRYLDTPSFRSRASEYDDLSELVTDVLMLGEVQYVRELYHRGDYQRGSELTASTLNTDPDGITWEGPILSGVPLIVDSESLDGIYFTTMPGGFTEVDEDR